MRRWLCAVFVLLLLGSCAGSHSRFPDAPAVLQLTSSAFADGGPIPARFTCDGEDVSPPLSWTGGSGVGSFALAVVDADARDFVHWAVYDISPSPAGAIPPGGLPS